MLANYLTGWYLYARGPRVNKYFGWRDRRHKEMRTWRQQVSPLWGRGSARLQGKAHPSWSKVYRPKLHQRPMLLLPGNRYSFSYSVWGADPQPAVCLPMQRPGHRGVQSTVLFNQTQGYILIYVPIAITEECWIVGKGQHESRVRVGT